MSTQQRLAIPAYFVPGAEWDRLTAAAPTVGLAVMNPASGPGTAFDETYPGALDAARRRGVTILGYVDTDNAKRNATDIATDVARYFDWYDVGGIFFDQTHVAGDQCVAFYRPLYEQVKAGDSSRLVVMNPGTTVSDSFMEASDVLVDFEGPAETFLSTTFPAWRDGYDPARFWHIVYDADPEAVETVVRWSRSSRAGWLFLSDQPYRSPQPGSYLYDRLPVQRLWSRLVAAVRR